jgi:hypothetical protein
MLILMSETVSPVFSLIEQARRFVALIPPGHSLPITMSVRRLLTADE